MPSARYPFCLFVAVVAAADPPAPLAATHSGQFVFSLAPKPFQKNPKVDVTVITEMTPAGRQVRPPTAGAPAYYIAQTVGYHDEGQGVQGERPLPVGVLRDRLEAALAAAHYLPAPAGQGAAVVMIFVWGSSNVLDPSASVDGPLDPTGTPDIGHRALIERAALIGGDKFAAELAHVMQRQDELQNANVGGTSPLEIFENRDFKTRRLVEQAQTDCFYVVASAYDAAGLARKQKILLWRTKITTAAEGVGMGEALPRLMVAGEPYFGKDMAEAATLTGPLIPEGRVEVGEPVVMPANAPTP
jgi:hypothetical protein